MQPMFREETAESNYPPFNAEGIAAGDFKNDGWPDLYVGVLSAPNRLFFNDLQGHFRNATTKEITDPEEALGVAVGDIDHDGDLDIFQTGGGSPNLTGCIARSCC